MSKSKALLIGINYISAGSHMQLRGCHNDALNMRAFLIRYKGYQREDITVALDTDCESTSKGGITGAILRLAAQSWRMDLDEVFIHYSGHGTQLAESSQTQSSKELDGLDEAIVSSDFSTAGALRDDMIQDLFTEFNPKTRIICIFDCCHSGTICDLPHLYTCEPSGPGSSQVQLKRMDVPAFRETCPPHIIAISGCRDSQVSMDAFNMQGHHTYSGAMTSTLLSVLRDGAGTNIPVSKVVESLCKRLCERGFKQLPALSTSKGVDIDGVSI